jgi:hypothetical protein
MPQFQQENLKVRTKNLSIARRLFFSFQTRRRNGAGLLVGFGNASGAKSPSAMTFLSNYIEQKASDAGLDTSWIEAWEICEACLKRRKTIFGRVQRVVEEAINSSGKHLWQD